MTATLVSSRPSTPAQVLWTLNARIEGEIPDLLSWMDLSEGQRQDASRAFFAARAIDNLAALRLKESVAWWRLGRIEQAFNAAHEAWELVAERASGTVQALVLSQLAACSEARGDVRGAIRSTRRAEALLVADAGDDTPQALALRAQLHVLLCVKGQESAIVAVRRDQTLAALFRSAVDPSSRARCHRLGQVFLGPSRPPHWALCYALSWRNVHGE